MRGYNAVSGESPIFRACNNRDFTAAQFLLTRGLASPFDVTPEGLTPLHLAAKQACAPICQLLVDYGADGNEVDRRGWTPLMFLARHAFRHEQDAFTVLKILVQQAQSDPMIPTNRVPADAYSYIPSALHGWQGSYKDYSWLLRQEHVLVDIDKIKSNWPTPWDIQAYNSENNDLILEALSDDKTAPEIAESPRLLILLILHSTYVALWSHTSSEPVINHFPKLRLVYALVKRGCTVHGDLYGWMGRLATVLYGLLVGHRFYLILNSSVTELYQESAADENLILTGNKSSFQAIVSFEHRRWQIICAWFRILADCGINLHDYARAEENIYPNGTICLHEVPPGFFLDIQFSFQYGPTPEDLGISWQDIWSRDPSYTPVPGAWTDEDGRNGPLVRLFAEYCISHQLTPTMDGSSGTYYLEKSLNQE
ncbi:MAG: hypothetical protein Q9214_003579 [Letrouitia sp. 1 TL-2023]